MTATAKLHSELEALGLADPDVSIPNLRSILERAGHGGSPGEFLSAISRAFRHAREVLRMKDADLRNDPSHEVLIEALGEASRHIRGRARILVIGCGDDYAGRDASYTAEVVEQAIPQTAIATLETSDLGRGEDHLGGPFDLVVTCSVLHFVAELAPVLRKILGLLGPDGMYLMAHEPNARFWRNPGLLEENRRMSVETSIRGARMWFSPAAYGRKLKAFVTRPPKTDLQTLVNAYLAERHGWQPKLTIQEIVRIADPHRPREFDGLRIGWNGFEPENLRTSAPELRRQLWSKTYDHLGYVVYGTLPRKWQEHDRELRRMHPEDGSAWTALWRAA